MYIHILLICNLFLTFFRYLAAELNSIEDEEIVDDIKHQISNIVYEGKKQFREKRNVN